MKNLILLFSIISSVNTFAQLNEGNSGRVKVVYGDDNRVDVPDYHDAEIRELARSTVALFRSSSVTNIGDLINIDEISFADDANVCSDEPFRNQPASAFCSGFLVAPDKIVTAGHCITTESACRSVKFIFDYAKNSNGTINTSFSTDQVYSCQEILGHKLEGAGIDYAIIKLDRAVVDRKPLELSDNRSLSNGDPLFVIGHPSGLPSKIADGANVMSVHRNDGFFKASLDTYGGNSGSAVFNQRTLKVEGILVRGAQDFVQGPSCIRTNYIGQNEGSGESCSLISQIEENGFSSAPATPVGEDRYVWLDSDMTCNLFRGNNYIREVPDSLCNRGGEERYVWLDSDMTCNLFRGNNYIREVANSYCGRSSSAGERYVWLDSDMTCNLFRGSNYIREVANSYCGRSSNEGERYVWLNSDMTCNLFRGSNYIREVPDSYCR